MGCSPILQPRSHCRAVGEGRFQIVGNLNFPFLLDGNHQTYGLLDRTTPHESETDSSKHHRGYGSTEQLTVTQLNVVTYDGLDHTGTVATG
jgi:hypothetical protein